MALQFSGRCAAPPWIAGAAVAAVLLTGIYVHRANRDLDPLNARLRKECEA